MTTPIIDPIHSSLNKTVLIEASAGTGKTYTITSLVIRYLLGIENNTPLKLNEILIVTFTKAATAELRTRIYDRIMDVQQAFKGIHTEDTFIQEVLKIVPKDQYNNVRTILKEAERSMSDANIFTIHSFCQRFLSQNPLESQLPFDAKLETSNQTLMTETAKQFWREICYYFSSQLAAIAYPIYKNPLNLQSQIGKFLSIAPYLDAPNSIDELEQAVLNCQGDDGTLDAKKSQEILWAFAAQQFNLIFNQLKTKDGILFFDDLINETHKLIQKATPEQLEHIRDRYKIAMIDEFQDTDDIQYQIFSQLFGHTDDKSLLMIGDPKQSIYKFRGADIDTYLKAKQSAHLEYSLTTNYRSSTAVVDGINELFSYNPNAFLTEGILFQPVNTPESSNDNYLTIDQQRQKGVGLAFLAEGNNKSKFIAKSADYTAKRIQQLLSSGKIIKNGEAHDIQNQDITILVRGKGDASIILSALRDANLPAVYLSDKSKVFQSKAARLILLFLSSLLDHRNQELMKQSFASPLYQLSLEELHTLLSDDELTSNHELYTDFLIEREQCLKDWEKLGIIPMMDQFLHRHDRIHRLRNHDHFDRIMTDIRHLCELLQTQSLLSPTKEALLEWLTEQIADANESEDELGGASNSLRLENEMNVITIMTIHGSKGLEFPIAFIPSMIEAKKPEPPYIVDKDNNLKSIDYDDNKEAIEIALKNEHAENMRLFYVAMTRAKYYCEFMISENFLNNKTNINDQTVFSALFNTEPEEAFMLNRLQQFRHIQILPMDAQENIAYIKPINNLDNLSAAEFTGKINRSWNISSFTQLTKNAPHSYFATDNPDEPENIEDELSNIEEQKPSIFTFPRGSHVGTFIHDLFEKHHPQELLDKAYLTNLMTRVSFSEDVSKNLEMWVDVIHDWLSLIFKNELLPDLQFSDALQVNALHELEFLFPVKKPLTSEIFNQYLQEYRGTKHSPQLDFYTLQGMMKGFIDLIFMHNGKFYIVDYKTNHLGNHSKDYDDTNLNTAMLDNYYDVQYLIYSVALTRYLKFRMPNYNYDEHFGGVFYLFVRGMTDIGSDGIYFRKPTEKQIEQLDQLMGANHD